MSDEIVVLREYGNEAEAGLDAAILEANGIAAQVSADTAGGALPSIAMIYPIRLLVHSSDAELAAQILDTSVDAAPDSDPPRP
jgi:hypothetical protein